MIAISFADELEKLGVAEELAKLLPEPFTPLASLGVLLGVHRKRAAEEEPPLEHAESPPRLEVDPADAQTRSRDGRTTGLIQPGRLGGVTPAPDPIDRDKFNLPWRRR